LSKSSERLLFYTYKLVTHFQSLKDALLYQNPCSSNVKCCLGVGGSHVARTRIA
jgi:hypothetical protein